MMEPNADIQAKPEAKKQPAASKAAPRRGGIFESIWVDIAGVAITLGAGVSSAIYHIGDYFLKNAEEDRLFKDDVHSLQEGRANLHDFTPETHAEARGKSHALAKIRQKYDRDVKKQTAQMGYKWPWQKWEYLHDRERGKVLIKAGTSITVALGAVVSLMALMSMSKKQDEFEKHINDMNGNGQQR